MAGLGILLVIIVTTLWRHRPGAPRPVPPVPISPELARARNYRGRVLVMLVWYACALGSALTVLWCYSEGETAKAIFWLLLTVLIYRGAGSYLTQLDTEAAERREGMW